MVEYVYVVIESVKYEGDTVKAVYREKADAIYHAQEQNKKETSDDVFWDVEAHKVL